MANATVRLEASAWTALGEGSRSGIFEPKSKMSVDADAVSRKSDGEPCVLPQ